MTSSNIVRKARRMEREAYYARNRSHLLHELDTAGKALSQALYYCEVCGQEDYLGDKIRAARLRVEQIENVVRDES